jgi:Ribbon-helix-helix protein, copG family
MLNKMLYMFHKKAGGMMKVIQVTIEEDLLQKVDHIAHQQNVARSRFIRDALENAVRQLEIQVLEQKQAEGYRRFPVEPGEFDVWESEQEWG